MTTKPNKEDQAAIKELDRLLKKMKPEFAKEIRQLFGFVLLGEEIDPDVTMRWRQLGFLTKDNKIVVSPNFAEQEPLEIAVMSFAYAHLFKVEPVLVS
jgi:hypothetical protein